MRLKILDGPVKISYVKGMNVESIVKIAADNVKQLRRVDVERVLNEGRTYQEIETIRAYLNEHRPDLQGYTDEMSLELIAEKGLARL